MHVESLLRDSAGSHVLHVWRPKEHPMWVSKRAVLTTSLTALLAFALALAVGALGDRGGGGGGAVHGTRLKDSLAPSVPADPPFHTVGPGAAPWVLRRGEGRGKHHPLRPRGGGVGVPPGPGGGTP